MTRLSAVAPSGIEPATWAPTTSKARPPSRSSRVSPTQTTATRPACQAASAFARTSALVSPLPWRRSEWPTIAWLQPTSLSISALSEPVNAPFGAAWQSWPPSAMLPCRTSPTRTSRVAGGHTRRSQARRLLLARFASSAARPRPSARNPFIFQLPAISRFRSGMFCAPRWVQGGSLRMLRLRPALSIHRAHDHTGRPMLQALRTKAGSIVAKILFGLLIISFGFWGIYTRSDYFQGHSPETVIATVGDRSIRAEELQKALEPAIERLRNQLGTGVDQQQLKQLGMIDTLLDQLINRALLDQETARLGLEASDDLVRNAIYENPAFRGQDGRFDRGLFNQVLTVNRLTEEQLIERLRREIPRSNLLQALTAGVTVPQPVVEAVYRHRGEKRIAEIVAFPVASAADPGHPSETDLANFHDTHADLFRAPEYRGFTVVGLAAGDVQKPGSIPEEKLRQEYEQRKEEFEVPERREVQQILAPAEEKAKQAEAALAAGKDWKEVATTVAGMDPETIDLGLLKREELPDLLAGVAFELPVNKATDPIKSPLGWHILRVVKIEPPTTQTFEQAKEQIETELSLQEAVGKLDKIANEADDALAGGASLADLASKFGLKLATIPAVDTHGRHPDGKPVQLPVASNEVLKTAFGTDQGQSSRMIDTPEGAIFAVHVDKVTQPQVRPLDEVKDEAIAAWQAEQKRAVVMNAAEALAAAVKPEQPLAKLAKEKKLTVTTSPPLSRNAQQGNPVPPPLVAKLFAAKQGDMVTAADQTGAYAAQLTEVQVPETMPENVAKALSEQLRGEARVDVAGEFTEALRKRYPVEIKRDALDRMF